VSKLVAHEAEVGLTTQGHGDQADHLVQGNAAVDDGAAGPAAWGDGKEGGRGGE